MDISEISILAIRAGCLIVDSMMDRLDAVTRFVYWDPVGSGRLFLREQTTIFRLAAGEDDTPAGVVSILGARLSERAAADLGALRLRGAEDRPILAITRVEGSDKQVRGLIASKTTTNVEVEGLVECAQPARVLVPISLASIDVAFAWFDKQLQAPREAMSPRVTTETRIPVTSTGESIVETIETIAPKGLFAIRSHDGRRAQPRTVVFYTNANNGHHGPNREWVELGREVALNGGQALRWDRRGAGESGVPIRNEPVFMYSDPGIADAVDAARYARGLSSNLAFVGVCSGAWYAAQAGRVIVADLVVLVSSIMWSWRVKKALRAQTMPSDVDPVDWELTRRARLRHAVQRMLPYSIWRQLGVRGVAQVPEVLVAPLSRQGSAVEIVLCPSDTKLFDDNHGERGLGRLASTRQPPHMTALPTGDHAAYHQTVLTAIRQTTLDWVSKDGIAPEPLRVNSMSAR
ncbi:alpha/beta hydrolase [Williamsia sterculiae]|nr:alpha/beta hydrolase [Williamsia sterculiae]